jgi:ferrous iron transport protein A
MESRRILPVMPFESAIIPAAALLGSQGKGFRGRIVRVGGVGPSGLPDADLGELERRLLEIGFIEDAVVEIVHQGLVGRDPIAIRINEMTVALRRREANAILVEPTG